MSFRAPSPVIPSAVRNPRSAFGAVHFVTDRLVSNTLDSSECAPQNDSKKGASFRPPYCHSERPLLSFRTAVRNLRPAVGAVHFVTNRRVSNTLDSSECAPQNDSKGGTPQHDSEGPLLRMTVRGALLRMTVRRGRHSDPHTVIPSPPNVIPNAPYCHSEPQ